MSLSLSVYFVSENNTFLLTDVIFRDCLNLIISCMLSSSISVVSVDEGSIRSSSLANITVYQFLIGKNTFNRYV